MSSKETGPRLGRGLAALLGDLAVQTPFPTAAVRQVAVDLLEPNPFQPRSSIDPQPLAELTESIRSHGILQPLLVRPHPADPARYQIVAGERRWRAATAAGLHDVPALVRDTPDTDAAAIALVENLQRQDLNPLDEAEGYARLLNQFGLTQEALGQAVGKSRSHIANTLRLLNLPQPIGNALREGAISAGHARAMLTHPKPESLLNEVLNRQLSVRQTEALAALQPAVHAPDSLRDARDPDTLAIERQFSEQLGLRVRLSFNGRGGILHIYYTDMEQLDSLLTKVQA